MFTVTFALTVPHAITSAPGALFSLDRKTATWKLSWLHAQTLTATTEDGVAMALEHRSLPVGGVQFHPESLMSLSEEVGLRIVENAFRLALPVK